MRKRKSPIALVSVLAVMASVAFGVQYASSQGSAPADQPPAPPEDAPKPLNEPRKAESATDISKNIKIGLKSPASTLAEPQRGGPPGMSGGPTILNPMHATGKPEKPKPNTSSTSAQWYDKDSALGAKD